MSRRSTIVNGQFLLDQFSGAAAAYSLRRLRNAYTGSCIRVRRSSDNAETDIGFTPTGVLDTVALLAHVGAGNGFVTTWYDQSGNGRNVTQATGGNQPRIVNGGVLTTRLNKSAVEFGYSSGVHFLNYTQVADMYNIAPASYFSVASKTALLGGSYINSRLISLSRNANVDAGANGSIPIIFAEQTLFSSSPPDVGTFDAGARGFNKYTYDTTSLLTSIFQATTNTFYRNGVAGSTVTYSSRSLNINQLRVGDQIASSAGALNGFVQEIVIYATNQSANRTAIESNIMKCYGI
jgi:hypothetical protein